jgi:hypothetical protein
LTFAYAARILGATLLETAMARRRESIAVILALSLLLTPVFGATNSPVGAILSAVRAHVGTAPASAGTTVFGGDRLSTEQSGSIQVRAGAARLLLSASSSAMLRDADGAAAATLLSGTALFSTTIAKAFTLVAARAEIRPRDDVPTIAQVSIETPKQFIVRSSRGALIVTVDGETQIIPEGETYRVTLDSEAPPEPQGPRGAGAKNFPNKKTPQGKSNFYRALAIGAGVATYFIVDEAFESPDKP